MILESIELYNFGPYLGRHVMDLAPPADDKPVILVGALNGGGKTSMLDGIHLCFYGKLGQMAKRGSQRYEDYLRGAIHRRADPMGGARVAVTFRHRSAGTDVQYEVIRSWVSTGKGLREDLEVLCNGTLDEALSDTWAEQVDRFLPARLAPLFFFDGEQIENLADPDKAAGALKTAIHSLLGLDLVEQLQRDLVVLERNERKEHADSVEEVRALEEAEAAVRKAEEQIDLCAQNLAAKGEAHYAAQREAERIEQLFQEQGGNLYESRLALEAERGHIEQRIAEREQRQRDIMAGAGPFLLIPDLLRRVLTQHEAELKAEQDGMLAEVLLQRDQQLLRYLRNHGGKSLVDGLAQRMAADRAQREAECAQVDRYLGASPSLGHQLRALLDTTLPELERESTELRDALERDRDALTTLERKLASIPAEEQVAELMKQRAAQQQLVLRIEAELEQLRLDKEESIRQCERARDALDKLTRADLGDRNQRRDLERFLIHTHRAQESLQRYQALMVERHAQRIEKLVLESFRHLMRKQGLIQQLRIDPATCRLDLRGADEVIIRPNDLSAGERQLLAVSLLWGLARASGRPLPVIIDTPLGRLDGVHREHLVSRYFPCASHQVLLLSTDEEIDEGLYPKLKSRIGRSYTLCYDEELDSSRVLDGYFPEVVA